MALAFCACSGPLLVGATRTQPGITAAAKHVVIVRSDTNPAYDTPIKALVAQLDYRITDVTLTPRASKDAVVKAIRGLEPDLVIAVGAGALVSVAEQLQPTPVLFSMVLNQRKFVPEGQKHLFGVSLEVPAEIDFLRFKMIMPSLKRVLVIYSPAASGAFVAAAKEPLAAMGVELVAVAATNQAEVEAAYAKHRKGVNAVWMQSDPVVMNNAAWEFLRRRSRLDSVPIITSLSDEFARSGAVMSVSLDFAAIGSQMATLVQGVLDGEQQPQEIGIQAPAGGWVTVNLDVAREIGAEIPTESLVFVNRVIAMRQKEEP
jgi:putative ABC transport system substrate-binding protein